MIKFTEINKTETYVELTTEDGQKMIMPTSSFILIDDESGALSVKTTGSRRTIGIVPKQ